MLVFAVLSGKFCQTLVGSTELVLIYTRDATTSLTITPSLPVKHDLIVGGGWGPSTRRRRDTNTSARLCAKHAGGAYARKGGGGISRTLQYN